MRILISSLARARLYARIRAALGGAEPVFLDPGDSRVPGRPVDADIAFVSRDVTGLSTKHAVETATRRFYDALAGSQGLRWVHVHSAGADRPVYVDLLCRGVAVTTSSGANARIVVQTALAGILGLARSFPSLLDAQREHRWAPLIGGPLPPDLEGQTALVIGWGPIGRGIATLLQTLGVRVTAARGSDVNEAPAVATVPFERLDELLPMADWLVLACPLSPRTRRLVDAAALARLPFGARVVNVARGEVIDQGALIEALRGGRLGGAYLDVFEQEPLPADSPFWDLPNTWITPHSAGHSAGNERRVDDRFIENLGRWHRGEPLAGQAAAPDRP